MQNNRNQNKLLFDLTIKSIPLSVLLQGVVDAMFMEKKTLNDKQFQQASGNRQERKRLQKLHDQEEAKLNSTMKRYDRMFKDLIDQYRKEHEELIEVTADIFNMFLYKAIKIEGFNVKIDRSLPVYLKSIKDFADKFNMTEEEVKRAIDEKALVTCKIGKEVRIIE